MRACATARVPARHGVCLAFGSGISSPGWLSAGAGMTRPRAGRHEILSPRNARVTARRAVPSITEPSRARHSKSLNDVGESNFAAIVDRHNHLAGSGDHR